MKLILSILFLFLGLSMADDTISKINIGIREVKDDSCNSTDFHTIIPKNVITIIQIDMNNDNTNERITYYYNKMVCTLKNNHKMKSKEEEIKFRNGCKYQGFSISETDSLLAELNKDIITDSITSTYLKIESKLGNLWKTIYETKIEDIEGSKDFGFYSGHVIGFIDLPNFNKGIVIQKQTSEGTGGLTSCLVIAKVKGSYQFIYESDILFRGRFSITGDSKLLEEKGVSKSNDANCCPSNASFRLISFDNDGKLKVQSGIRKSINYW